MKAAFIAAFVATLAMFGMRGDSAPLATNDRYGHMQMKLEKTWFGFDVAQVNVWFNQATADRMRELAAGKRYTDALAERVARTAMQAEDVHVQVKFLRDASLGEFLDAAHHNLERARDADYISADTFATAWQGVKNDFAAFEKRGFKKGDQLIYRARPGSLETKVLAQDRVLLDRTNKDPGARRSMIASYFAPGTDFRKGLTRSLFQHAG